MCDSGWAWKLTESLHFWIMEYLPVFCSCITPDDVAPPSDVSVYDRKCSETFNDVGTVDVRPFQTIKDNRSAVFAHCHHSRRCPFSARQLWWSYIDLCEYELYRILFPLSRIIWGGARSAWLQQDQNPAGPISKIAAVSSDDWGLYRLLLHGQTILVSRGV